MSSVREARPVSGDGIPIAGDSDERRALAAETWLVVGLGVGLSAARSALSLADDLTAPGGLTAQSTTLNGSLAPGHPWIDLGRQLVFIASLLLPALLAMHLVRRSGTGLAAIGLLKRDPRGDLGLGLGIAAVVGAVGLGGYLASYAAGYSVTVVPANLPAVWWRDGVLVLSAVANATLEEVVLVGYLLHRCRRLGWRESRAALLSAGIRCTYHLYQGLAGALGNLLMGLLFARYFQTRRSILPLLVAHSVLDVTAFFGYTLLAGHVHWLPGAHG